jgi:hypothetical protein
MPTSSITTATSGLLLRSAKGNALRRQACSVRVVGAAEATRVGRLGRGFSSIVPRCWPGSVSV